MAENAQERELNAFGFKGLLRTGLVTGIISIQFGAIVALYSTNKDLNKQISDIKDSWRIDVVNEVRRQVNEQVRPTIDKLDTAITNVDSATTLFKEKLNKGR